MAAVTKDLETGIYRIGEDPDKPLCEFSRSENGVTISTGDGMPLELTAAEWKDLVNTMGYHGGVFNK